MPEASLFGKREKYKIYKNDLPEYTPYRVASQKREHAPQKFIQKCGEQNGSAGGHNQQL